MIAPTNRAIQWLDYYRELLEGWALDPSILN